MLASALAVSLVAAVRAESRTSVVAQEYDRKRRVDKLSYEVLQVEFVARQDVALSERVFTIAARIEHFVEFEFERKRYRFETASTFALGPTVDAPLQLEPGADAPYDERDIDRSGKTEG